MWHDGPVPPELSVYPGYLLARLGQASAARFHAALAPEDLHPRHFGVMSILAAQPGITQQRLAEHTAIDASSMVAVIDELEAKGLAERRPHPADRRARAVYLTPTATATLQRELFAGLSATEGKTLHELLLKLARTSGSPEGLPDALHAPTRHSRT
jgi:DNA-binding MarR family transcriptional regulator